METVIIYMYLATNIANCPLRDCFHTISVIIYFYILSSV